MKKKWILTDISKSFGGRFFHHMEKSGSNCLKHCDLVTAF